MMDIHQREWGSRHCNPDTGLIGSSLNLRAVTIRRGTWIARWLKFNAVGAIGIGIQLAALTLLARVLRLSIVVATGLAVETAIIHNFAWHHRWTWADRRCGSFVEIL